MSVVKSGREERDHGERAKSAGVVARFRRRIDWHGSVCLPTGQCVRARLNNDVRDGDPASGLERVVERKLHVQDDHFLLVSWRRDRNEGTTALNIQKFMMR